MFNTYRQYGITPIPVKNKKALVSWGDATLESRLEKNLKEPDIAIKTGDVVTVVDLDDPELLDFALDHFGPTPIQVQTPSGGFHLWYSAREEKTRQRLDGQAIDIRGVGGYAVAPGTPGYEFVKGGVGEIPDLPPVREGAIKPATTAVAKRPGPATMSGERNDQLFHHALRAARSYGTRKGFVAHLRHLNDQFLEPLPDGDVDRLGNQVWEYKQENRLFTVDSPKVCVDHAEHDQLRFHADAYVLLGDLRRNHGNREGSFALGNATGKRFGWGRMRLTKAIDALRSLGYIEITRPGGELGQGDPRMVRLIG